MNLNDQAATIMTTDPISVKKDTPVSQLRKLIDRRRVHHILVENKTGELMGMISTTDIMRTAHFPVRDEQLLAEHIMTTCPVTLSKEKTIRTLIDHFLENRYRAIPIVDKDNKLLGLVTPYDIMAALLGEES